MLRALVLISLSGCASAKLSMAGSVAADGRVFAQRARYPGQEDGHTASLVAEPTFQAELGDGVHVFKATPFYRVDPRDERRTHGDLREASYRLSTGSFELVAGSTIVTWGTLEMHRPSDVINQHDLVESLSETAKLGQPLVSLGWIGERASLKAFVLPVFRERTFPGVRGRLRSPAVIDVENAQFESPLGRWHPGGALRFTLNLGELDLGVSAFSGLSREPRFLLEFTRGQLVPRYEVMHQASVDVLWNLGGLNVKLEAFARLSSASLTLFGGGGVGVDYTFFQVVGQADLSLVLEGYYDSRPVSAPVTFYDHDVFGGARFALNDVANLEVTAGALVDVVSGATLGRVEVSRRFGERFRLSVGAHVFLGGEEVLQGSFARDSHGTARLAYFF